MHGIWHFYAIPEIISNQIILYQAFKCITELMQLIDFTTMKMSMQSLVPVEMQFLSTFSKFPHSPPLRSNDESIANFKIKY